MIFLVWLGARLVLLALVDLGRALDPIFVRRRGFRREPDPDHPP